MAGTYYSFNRILDKLFGNTVLTEPSTYYCALSTTSPAIDGSGFTEPVGSGYARVSISNSDKTNWTVAASGALSNVTAITFPESSGSWGTVVYVGLFDALTSGNLWFFDVLTPSRAIASSTTVLFAASAFAVSMTNS